MVLVIDTCVKLCACFVCVNGGGGSLQTCTCAFVCVYVQRIHGCTCIFVHAYVHFDNTRGSCT